ncbi:MAG: hypothetical protein P8M73_06065 [Luminiphilus sp.]|nr:hypothetical protein [Luminiphilus sp.]
MSEDEFVACLVIWMGAGVGTYVYSDVVQEGREFSVGNALISSVFGAVILPWLLISAVIKAATEAKELEKKETTAAKARATKEKRRQAALQGYGKLLQDLDASRKSFEEQGQILDEQFFKNCIKLATDVGYLTSQEVEHGASVFAIIKFARLNVFSSFSDEKAAEKYADKLGKALKKVKKYDG